MTRETQASIAAWARETFGPPASALHLAVRTLEEAVELIEASGADRAPAKAAGEIADLAIMAFQIAEHLGFDLLEAVDRKMALNRARSWRRDGGGVGQHVEPGASGGR